MRDMGNPQDIERRHEIVGNAFDVIDQWATTFDADKQRERDLLTITAMEQFGGSFVRALGAAARVADPCNLKTIKEEFGFYWSRYEAEAGRRLLKKYDETLPVAE